MSEDFGVSTPPTEPVKDPVSPFMRDIVTKAVFPDQQKPELTALEDNEPEPTTAYSFEDPMIALGLRGEDNVEEESESVKDPVSPFMRKIVTDAVFENKPEPAVIEEDKPEEPTTIHSFEDPMVTLGLKNNEEEADLPAENKESETKEEIIKLQEQIRILTEKIDQMSNPKPVSVEEVLPPPEPEIPPVITPEPEVVTSPSFEAPEEEADDIEEAEAKPASKFWEKMKEKGSRTLGFLAERAKGMATFGYWEFRQAEKMRKAASDVDKGVKAGSKDFEQEILNEEKDLGVIKNRLREAGNDVESIPDSQLKEFYGWLSKDIVEQKVIANQEVEKKLVEESIKKIETRLQGRAGAGYRTFSGEAVLDDNKTLSPEKRKEVETRLRSAIGALRTSRIDSDIINFGKVVKNGLDSNWTKRYYAGGIEMALAAAGVSWIVFSAGKFHYGAGLAKEGIKQAIKSSATEAVTNVPVSAPVGLESVIPGPEKIMQPLKDNLWNMGKDILQQQGVPNPTNSQIMEVTKQLANDNSTSVTKWGLNGGKWIDTVMPKGLPISIGGAIKIASLAAKGVRLATGV